MHSNEYNQHKYPCRHSRNRVSHWNTWGGQKSLQQHCRWVKRWRVQRQWWHFQCYMGAAAWSQVAESAKDVPRMQISEKQTILKVKGCMDLSGALTQLIVLLRSPMRTAGNQRVVVCMFKCFALLNTCMHGRNRRTQAQQTTTQIMRSRQCCLSVNDLLFCGQTA